jgi:hypothetical protein
MIDGDVMVMGGWVLIDGGWGKGRKGRWKSMRGERVG